MANPEHLEILKQGVEVWNAWRKQTFQRADLSRADLRGMNLKGAQLEQSELYGANLRQANLNHSYLMDSSLISSNLEGADLRNAEMHGANLNGTNLRRADLSGARLDSANLTGADLTYANLSMADVTSTNFHAAELCNANFNKTFLNETLFADSVLTDAKNLDKSLFGGPCVLDSRTLIRTRGGVPEFFLRGCGLSDTYIEYIPSLFQDRAIQFYSCFISYSSKDQEFADRLYADLQNRGVRCWFAPEDLKIGDKFRQRIDESIKVYDKLMIVLSENSLESDWVESEVESALEKEQRVKTPVLFPIRLDHAVMDTNQAWAADIRRKRHIGDFSNWKDHDAYKEAFERLLRDLKESGKEEV